MSVVTGTRVGGFSYADEKVDSDLCKVWPWVRAALDYANASPPPPASLAAQLEYPDPTGQVDYSTREPAMGLEMAQTVTERTVPEAVLTSVKARIEALRAMAVDVKGISLGDAVNLAILEEMLRDPTTVAHAEDLQAGPHTGIHFLSWRCVCLQPLSHCVTLYPLNHTVSFRRCSR